MRKLLIIFSAALLLFACKGKGDFKNGRLSPKVMQDVLLDINLAEAYSTLKKDSSHLPGTKNMDSLGVYYKDIFAHHKITQEQFMQSLNWYKDHPDDMDSLYNNMIPRITKWQAQPLKTTPPKDTTHTVIAADTTHTNKIKGDSVKKRIMPLIKKKKKN